MNQVRPEKCLHSFLPLLTLKISNAAPRLYHNASHQHFLIVNKHEDTVFPAEMKSDTSALFQASEN